MGNGIKLPFVSNKREIMVNVATLNGHLEKPNTGEREYAKGLIGRGRCFIVVFSPEGYRFYPSRFMGYAGNSMEKHKKMGELAKATGTIVRDGKDTNLVISNILGSLIESDDDQWFSLEEEFHKFCRKLNVLPSDHKRKFWKPIKP